jgi:hypothetical protein
MRESFQNNHLIKDNNEQSIIVRKCKNQYEAMFTLINAPIILKRKGFFAERWIDLDNKKFIVKERLRSISDAMNVEYIWEIN